MRKVLLTTAAILMLPTLAHAATIPAGDWIQWYSGASYFDFPNQTFEFATDIALPTNVGQTIGGVMMNTGSGSFAPFAGSLTLTPFYGDGIGVDIPLNQLGSIPPFEQVSLNGLVAAGTIWSTPLDIWNNQPDLFIANGSCTITLTGFDPTAGLCGISTGVVADPRAPAGWWTGYGFVSAGNPVTVPGPVVGAGLPGFLGALALLWLRRRRNSN